jgi:hypothetical protein
MYQNEQPPPGIIDSTGINGKNQKILEYAASAIHALIESTRAFHGIESDKRIIITNVFGTVHA